MKRYSQVGLKVSDKDKAARVKSFVVDFCKPEAFPLESLRSFLTFYQLFKDSPPTIIRTSTTRDSQLGRLYFPFDIRDHAHSAHHYIIP